jgi:hypothetical protein
LSGAAYLQPVNYQWLKYRILCFSHFQKHGKSAAYRGINISKIIAKNSEAKWNVDDADYL